MSARPASPSRPAVAWASLAGNLFLVAGTVVFGSSAALLGWLPGGRRWVYWMARLWSRGLLAASGARLRAVVESPLEPHATYVFMSNHQSLFDIPALIASLPGQTRFLAKRSLFSIPIFGWAMRAGGFIAIDRRDRSRAGESFAQAIAELRGGASAVVFPEGTRSEDGRLLPFQRGGFLLALKSGLPIVPVGVSGSLEMRRRSQWSIRPGRITVRCGGPIATLGRGVRDRRELEREVRVEIARLAGVETA